MPKHKKRQRRILTLLPFIVLVAVLLLFIPFFWIKQHKEVKKHALVLTIPKTPIATPTTAPSPTSTPTPTPIPMGYCLHIPVIYYHHVEPMAQAQAEGHASLTVDSGIFTQQMAYLSSHGYTFYSAEQLVDALRGHTTLSGKPVVVTIDDGYIDTYQNAYPIAKQYGVKFSLMVPTGLLENPGYMTWNNLKEMVDSGTVFAYDHTWSHFSLPSGTYDKEESEIMTAKKQLEDHLGAPNLIFAYPYGSSNAMSISILEKNGFKGAFTTIPSFLQCDGFIYSLHRNRIGNASLSAYGL